MFATSLTTRLVTSSVLIVLLMLFSGTAPSFAPVEQVEPPLAPQGAWWLTQPEDEVTSPYYDSIPYWQVAPTLHEIEQASDRVKVDVIGQSAEGRDLFLVTITEPTAFGNLGHYKTLRRLMVQDPAKAQEMLDQFTDFKVPVYVHASIHGNEYPGVDAAVELIKTFAFSDDSAVLNVLDNTILLVNVVANPDGRVHGTRGNGNGFDLNRDFITVSQPETRSSVNVIRDWMPMVVLDLHGFSYPMLIEPCTPPHNPNYEYDLYLKWAVDEGEAMAASVNANTGYPTTIPYEDFKDSWDDWPPIFTPMYAMYHGAYGHTLETPSRGIGGVSAHYWAVRGALDFASANKAGMIYDQIEILKRGFLGLPQQPIPQEILDRTKHEQYRMYAEFPAAYVIPAIGLAQQDPHAAAYLVDFLIFHGVEVEKATETFVIGDRSYPSGTYLVWLKQPLRGLANVILSDGWDISYYPGLTMYDISAWSHPLLWGVTRLIVWDPFDVKTAGISHADAVAGSVSSGTAGYAYLPASNDAIRATNDLLGRGVPLERTTSAFTDGSTEYGVGTFVLSATVPGAANYASEIASRYGLAVYGLTALPSAVDDLTMPRIAANLDDEGVAFAMRDLGFSYDVVGWSDLNHGFDLSAYDVWVYASWWSPWTSLSRQGKAALTSFVDHGGNFLGIGPGGVDLGVRAGLVEASFRSGDWSDNGIVHVTYTGDLVSAQYPADSFAFVYWPHWFTKLGGDVKVSATIQSGEFFAAGFWPKRDAAAGRPVVVWREWGEARIVLMGLDPTFRAHPLLTYRLVANSLYLT